MAEKKLIPYSVYLPVEYHAKLKAVAKERKAAELEKRMAQIIEAQKKVHELAKPKPHTWEVVAVQ